MRVKHNRSAREGVVQTRCVADQSQWWVRWDGGRLEPVTDTDLTAADIIDLRNVGAP